MTCRRQLAHERGLFWSSALLAVALHTGSACASPRVEFTPTDTLRGFSFADLMPWSPRGSLLAVESEEGLYVYDAGRPGESPERIDGGLGREQWSPDGAWIARLRASPEFRQRDTIDVIAASGTDRYMAYAGPRVWPILWAADGRLYVWPLSAPAFRTLRTPLEPSEQNLPARSTLVIGQMSPLGLLRFVPGSHPRTEPLAMIDSTFGTGHRMLMDALPEHGRFLVMGPPRAGGPLTAVVIDTEGRAITPQSSVQGSHSWYSLTHDGRAVLGAVVTTEGTEAATILAAELFIEDARLSWRSSISGTGTGMNPWMSRDGRFLAYVDPMSRSICIGRLDVRLE